jgi:MFS family permease
VVWSLFTTLCGTASSFVQLALFRLGVGVGEAGGTPPSLSLITDEIPRERRAFAMSIFMAGTAVGSLIGMVFGGYVADLWGWRMAFLVAGAPGLVFAVIAYFSLDEPRRRGEGATLVEWPSLVACIKQMVAVRSLVHLVAGATSIAFSTYGLMTFIGPFVIRRHHDALNAYAAQFDLGPLTLLGLALGVAMGVSGIVGTIVGGILADRYGKSDARALAWVPSWSSFLAAPCYLMALLSDSLVFGFVALTIGYCAGNAWQGPYFSALHDLVRPHSRATVTALQFLLANLVGLGLGPVVVGSLSDYLQAGYAMASGSALGAAMIAVVVAVQLLGALLFGRAARAIESDVEAIAAETSLA